jgi:autotransporter-associated beta strand protein
VLILTAANTHTGTSTNAGGTGNYLLANSLALQNSTFRVTNTGASTSLTFDSSVVSNAFTLGGLEATASGNAKNFALENNASTAIALSVGNNNANTTYNGVMSGNGSLTKIGNGTLTLGGTNTYTGTTTISAGTLQVGNGTDTGSIASSSGIVNNAALVYNVGAGNRTYANIISGNGTLTQAGSGTLTLSGNNTYTGTTAVNAGTLLVNGNQSAATANVTVAANATLGGFGTIGGATTVNGNLAPGDGIGKITFTAGLTTGNLTDSSLKFELGANTTAGGTYDTVETNALNIGSTLDFPDFEFTGTPAVGNYTLISSGSPIVGTLGGNLTGPIGALTGAISQSGNDIILAVTGGTPPPPYTTWPGGDSTNFYADANGDGVPNGMTWLLGGANTTSNGLLLLPAPVVSGGNMTLSFTTPAVTAPAKLFFEYGNNLVGWTPVQVPTANGTFVNGSFTVTPVGNGTNNSVILTVNGNASAGGKLFGRFNSQQN